MSLPVTVADRLTDWPTQTPEAEVAIETVTLPGVPWYSKAPISTLPPEIRGKPARSVWGKAVTLYGPLTAVALARDPALMAKEQPFSRKSVVLTKGEIGLVMLLAPV
ncbi:hypothetical protein GCM10023189_02660 [Nibrella saemangeumensis]|uniref:Uncharacterized protein n=1 Tax=Nibrella saemangeumensis TaxID=1084526 RepID=A0ABP8MCP9_9BACT